MSGDCDASKLIIKRFVDTMTYRDGKKLIFRDYRRPIEISDSTFHCERPKKY